MVSSVFSGLSLDPGNRGTSRLYQGYAPRPRLRGKQGPSLFLIRRNAVLQENENGRNQIKWFPCRSRPKSLRRRSRQLCGIIMRKAARLCCLRALGQQSKEKTLVPSTAAAGALNNA